MKKSNIKLPLTDAEKQRLKHNRIKLRNITDYAVDELEVILVVSFERAREIYALVEFQSIPSVGIRFAEDLVSLGYYSIDELKGKDGALLTNEFEVLKGYWIDPCVEDQFRLVVYYANTKDSSKNWWNFTDERKKYRVENGYPSNRPTKAWHETLNRP
ncbi:MAG: Pathogenicity locus [Bacteroidales bacterium]|nr:MAG: Pathogenicity locus [Bacteroidales bacterium]